MIQHDYDVILRLGCFYLGSSAAENQLQDDNLTHILPYMWI